MSQDGDGALAGQAEVSVTKREQVELPKQDWNSPDYDPKAVARAAALIPEPKSLIPERYAIAEKSGIEVTIEPTEDNPPLSIQLTR